MPIKPHFSHIIFKLQKTKDKEQILREARGLGRDALHVEEQGLELYQTSHQKQQKQEESRVKYLKS